jgi:pyrroline-5-carboxylate reductase
MRVLVVGAGRMGAIRVEDLVADPRVSEVLIANRNEQRAQDLAATWGATALRWDQATAMPSLMLSWSRWAPMGTITSSAAFFPRVDSCAV